MSRCSGVLVSAEFAEPSIFFRSRSSFCVCMFMFVFMFFVCLDVLLCACSKLHNFGFLTTISKAEFFNGTFNKSNETTYRDCKNRQKYASAFSSFPTCAS